MLPTSDPLTVHRKPLASRSTITLSCRSGQNRRQPAGSANSAATRDGGTARKVSSTTSTLLIARLRGRSAPRSPGLAAMLAPCRLRGSLLGSAVVPLLARQGSLRCSLPVAFAAHIPTVSAGLHTESGDSLLPIGNPLPKITTKIAPDRSGTIRTRRSQTRATDE